MDSIVAVALVNAAVSIVGTVGAYLGLRSKLDHQQDDRQAGTTHLSNKLDEVKGINEYQIVASNNFNQKFAKLEVQSTQTARDVLILSGKVDRVGDNVKMLAEGTGIPIAEH